MTSAAAAAVDWSLVDVAGGPSVSMPTIVSSSGLFDGELFGDELIDIYNSTVGDEGGHHCHDDDGVAGIPLLDLSKVDHDEDHPGARVAVAAAAMDDGLGAFRASTSFNDLTTLLQPDAAKSDVAAEPAAADAVVKAKASTNSKKRSGSESSSVGSKRKAVAASTAAGGGRRASPKKSKTTPKAATAAATASTVAVAAAAAKASQMSATTMPDHHHAVAAAVAITAPSPSPDSVGQGLPATSPVTPDGSHNTEMADASSTTTTTTLPVAPIPEAVKSQVGSVATAAVATAFAPPPTTTTAPPAVKAAAATVAVPSSTTAATAPSGSNKNHLRVDTSTAHIKALTGNNWVAACSGGSSSAAPPHTTSSSAVSVCASTTSDDADAACSSSLAGDDGKGNNRARRQNLTPDERARQNRDRNREHARNTRLRKKAYVEELKRTLTELVAQRDKADLEKRQSAQRELEQREVRFRVIEEFLKLRGRNEVNFSRWAAILEDGFSLVLPVCDFYTMQQPPAASFEQQLEGVSDVMADANNFSAFLQSLRAPGAESTPVTFSYQCDRKNFFMDGCNAVMEWTATSLGAANNQELALKGIIRGKFSPASNKLISSSISFDTGIVSTQLRMRTNAAMTMLMAPPTTAAAHQQQETADAEAAAQADAILDSLEMPHVDVLVPSSIVSVMLQPPASVSDSCSSMGESTNDKDTGMMSSDESMSAEA
jgi:hypothetical protein